MATGPDGLHVIAAVLEPIAFTAHADAFASLLRFWRSRHEFTIVDLGHGVTAALLGLATEIDQIFRGCSRQEPTLGRWPDSGAEAPEDVRIHPAR